MIGPSEVKIRKVLKKFLKQIMNFFFSPWSLVFFNALSLPLSLSNSFIFDN